MTRWSECIMGQGSVSVQYVCSVSLYKYAGTGESCTSSRFPWYIGPLLVRRVHCLFKWYTTQWPSLLDSCLPPPPCTHSPDSHAPEAMEETPHQPTKAFSKLRPWQPLSSWGDPVQEVVLLDCALHSRASVSEPTRSLICSQKFHKKQTPGICIQTGP